MAVDHDHKTGKVRKLLCLRCNVELGVYENQVLSGSLARIHAYIAEHA